MKPRCDQGVQVIDKELMAVNLIKDDFHGERSYIIKPNRS
jgi:hypothetical protein